MKKVLRSPVPSQNPVRVTGRVITPPNSALQAVAFRRVGVGVDDVQAPVARDGTFDIPQMLPGTYTTHALPEPSFPNPPQTVTIANEGVTGLEIKLPGLRQIVVRISVEGNGPPPAITLAMAGLAGGFNRDYPLGRHASLGEESPLTDNIVSALKNGADLQLIATGTPTGPNEMSYWMPGGDLGEAAKQPANGVYTVTLPDGEYRLAAIAPRVFPPDVDILDKAKPSHSVKAITYGATNLLDEPLIVGGNGSNEIRITLAPAE
jgi:hypothetical protein